MHDDYRSICHFACLGCGDLTHCSNFESTIMNKIIEEYREWLRDIGCLFRDEIALGVLQTATVVIIAAICAAVIRWAMPPPEIW